MADLPIPVIDTKVEHMGVSDLRKLDGKKLREVDDNILVIQDHNTPLAVLLSYEKYLIVQDQLMAVVRTFELLNSSAEMQALIAGLADMKANNTKGIDSIRKELKDQGQ